MSDLARGTADHAQIAAGLRYIRSKYGREYPFSAGEVTPPPETEFAAGAVYGIRWWTIEAPDFSLSPAFAEHAWDPGRTARLRGIYAAWQPGVNTAECLSGVPDHDKSVVPYRSCGCGFWAYWRLCWHEMHGTRTALPVVGVIKGWGRTLAGNLGLRCEKAKIVALHVPMTITPAERRPDPWAAAGFTGRVFYYGDDSHSYAYADPTPESVAEAEAWAAVIGDRLEQLYPGARVFEDERAMLASFPPTRQ